MKNISTSTIWLYVGSILFLAALMGAAYQAAMEFKHSESDTIRVSTQSVEEISRKCKGKFKDLSASKEFVYANCNDGQPVTVQNYSLK